MEANAYEYEKWNKASFRVLSLSLTCSEITEMLGTQPTWCMDKGDLLYPKAAGNRAEHSLWNKESGLEDACPLDEHVSVLVDFVEGRLEKLRQMSPRCWFSIFCGFSSRSGQGGFTLESSLLLRLTMLPIDLILDLYPPGEFDE
jgi:hypothetical protein